MGNPLNVLLRVPVCLIVTSCRLVCCNDFSVRNCFVISDFTSSNSVSLGILISELCYSAEQRLFMYSGFVKATL